MNPLSRESRGRDSIMSVMFSGKREDKDCSSTDAAVDGFNKSKMAPISSSSCSKEQITWLMKVAKIKKHRKTPGDHLLDMIEALHLKHWTERLKRKIKGLFTFESSWRPDEEVQMKESRWWSPRYTWRFSLSFELLSSLILSLDKHTWRLQGCQWHTILELINHDHVFGETRKSSLLQKQVSFWAEYHVKLYRCCLSSRVSRHRSLTSYIKAFQSFSWSMSTFFIS